MIINKERNGCTGCGWGYYLWVTGRKWDYYWYCVCGCVKRLSKMEISCYSGKSAVISLIMPSEWQVCVGKWNKISVYYGVVSWVLCCWIAKKLGNWLTVSEDYCLGCATTGWRSLLVLEWIGFTGMWPLMVSLTYSSQVCKSCLCNQCGFAPNDFPNNAQV